MQVRRRTVFCFCLALVARSLRASHGTNTKPGERRPDIDAQTTVTASSPTRRSLPTWAASPWPRGRSTRPTAMSLKRATRRSMRNAQALRPRRSIPRASGFISVARRGSARPGLRAQQLQSPTRPVFAGAGLFLRRVEPSGEFQSVAGRARRAFGDGKTTERARQSGFDSAEALGGCFRVR